MFKPPELNTDSFSRKTADITKKKETEETSRESEVKIKDKKDILLNILDSMMDGIYIVDQSYHIEYINPILIKEFGSPKNKKCYEYTYARSEPCPWCKIPDILEGKTIRSERYFDINQKIYEMIDAPLKNIDGTISKLKLFHDITNLRNTINALKLDEERLNSLLKLNQMKSASKKEITEFALEECVRLTGSKVGYLHFVDEDQKTIQLYLWSKNVMKQCYTEDITHYPIEEAGIWADAFRMRKPVIHNDYQNIPNKKGYPEGHFPIIRHMSIPVFDREKIVAIVGVGNKDDPYDHTDVRQLTLFMESMWGLLKKKEEEIAERDKKYIKFLNDLQYFNTSIKTSYNLKKLMDFLLNAVLSLFNCDRAFLMYPLNPEAEYWEIPMEATKPEYLGSSLIGKRLPMQPEITQVSKLVLESSEAIAFGPSKAFDFPPGVTWDQFKIKSALLIALHPKIGEPWEFGIHQCSHLRVWNNYEKELFTEISYRITDSLNNWLYFQKLKESEEKFRNLFENARDGILLADIETKQFYTGNKRICENTGYSLEEIENLSLIDIHPKDKLPYILEQFEMQQNHEIDLAVDIPVKRKDGSIFYVDINATTIDIGGKSYLMGIFRDITDRKTSDQQLKDSEKRYRELVENLNECVAVYDAVENGSDFIFKDYNKAAEIADQITRDELLGKTICEMFPGVHEFGLLDVFKRVWKTGVPEHHPITLYKDQRIQGWRENYVYKLPSGEIVAVYQDMTEKMKLDQQLKESEMRYRQLFESSPLYIFLLDLDWNILDCNFAVESILGYSKESLIGKNMIDTPLLDYTDINLLRKRTQKINNGGTVEPVELRIPRSDGKLIWVSSTSSLAKINEKVSIQIQGRDVTKRREAEQKLIESELKYRNLVETMTEGLAIINEKSRFTYVNKSFCTIVGYSEEELLGTSVLKYLDSANQSILEEQLIQRRMGISNPYELTWIKKNGQHLHTILSPKSIINADGNYIGSFAVITNITERKKVEKLITKENLKLKELSQMRQDLINRISHELKTPLTSIFGVSQAFIEIPKDELNEDILEYIEIFYRGSLRLKALIDNLLDASRLDSKRIELKFQDENLSMLIRECVDDLRYLVSSRKHTIKINLPNELFFKVDKFKVSQAIINLISNAIKNTPVGGTIYIYLNEMEKYIDINIKDPGVGLTEKEKEQLFQKFGKIERYGQNLDVDIEGVGLGLYISKEIVELHGGEIIVESNGRNKGATFTIRLYKNN